MNFILYGAKCFCSGIFQKYLVKYRYLENPAEKCIKYFSDTTWIDSWKSNGMLKNIENIAKSKSNFAPTFVDHYVLPDISFHQHCLINNICIPKA